MPTERVFRESIYLDVVIVCDLLSVSQRRGVVVKVIYYDVVIVCDKYCHSAPAGSCIV